MCGHAAPSVRAVACPGHSEDSSSLVFQSPEGKQVWIVGDAILNEDWLLAWGYYWPNEYDEREIIDTWRSVARILVAADIVVPGHGSPIRITVELLQELVKSFLTRARYAEECPDVGDSIRARISHMEMTAAPTS